MEEYKESLGQDFVVKEENKYMIDYSSSLNIIKELSEKEEFSFEDLSFIRQNISQFNAKLINGGNNLPSCDDLAEFDAPQSFIRLYLKLTESDIRISFLQTIDILSKNKLMNHTILLETEIAQYFIELFNSIVFEGGNDSFIECHEIATIFDNFLDKNETAARDFISIGLSNALIEVFMKVAPLSVNDASEKYMKLFTDSLIRLRNDLSLYSIDIEETISFIMNAVNVGNPFAISLLFESVENMLRNGKDISALFSEESYTHVMLEYAFNHHNVHALNIVGEYILYDEKAPQLHDDIINVCHDVDFASILDTVSEMVENNSKDVNTVYGLLIIIGNIFDKLKSIPETFEPFSIKKLEDLIREKGTLKEKAAISFLLLELWMNIPVELANFIATDDELDFVFSTALAWDTDLQSIALKFVQNFLDEISMKFPEMSFVKNSINEFLTDIFEAGKSEDSEIASLLISKYVDK